MKFLQLVLIIFSLIFTGNLHAEEKPDETLTLKIPDSTEITIERFGSGSNRILWIPSENGLEAAQTYPLARSMAEKGLQVWLADLHNSYFLTPDRSSLTGIPLKDIADLIQLSLPQDEQGKLHILTSGRGAALSLMALQNWQENGISDPRFGGIVLLSPNLSADTPEPGQDEAWLPVVVETRAPIFILQPENSGKRWYLEDLVNKLQSGGSVVYSKLIKGVGDGYLNRPERTAEEVEEAHAFPELFQQALDMLASIKQEPNESNSTTATTEVPTNTNTPPAAQQDTKNKDSGWEVSEMKDGLQRFPGNELAPALKLTDMDGKTHDLNDYRGKVVLLNFWATWCPPCIKEIPSLGKLQQKFSQDDFIVLSVDMGESEEDVAMFLENFPADYPVMLDPQGTTVKDWKLRAYPTTFVIDRAGYIRLAYFGGLEWDGQNVVDTLIKEMKLAAK